jgi:glycerol-3-phosphate dehydrogenase
MDRQQSIASILNTAIWDIVIIGGGATGLGAAVDAANRGYKVLLVEQADFAKATSSRSTKLVHGGVRYLQQGNIGLIREALKERKILLRNAPHICKSLQLVIPVYSWWQKFYYGIGLKLYDIIAGKNSLGKTTIASAKKVQAMLPTINIKNLCGGIIYFDGQFDDARLAINLAQTATDIDATVLNYCKVINFNKINGQIKSVEAIDIISQTLFTIQSKIFINATGVFVDDILQKIIPNHLPIVKVSQGVHIVIDKKYLPTDKALMIPKTTDGRVLFALPWHDKIVVGTTDTAIDSILLEPIALKEEINFILTNLNKYLTTAITQKEILSVFAGLRPLVNVQSVKNTASLSREHTILSDGSGVITITGGKWTTYRKMAAEVIDKAAAVANLPSVANNTAILPIHGADTTSSINNESIYGSDAILIENIIQQQPELGALIHPNYLFTKAQVVFAVKYEMAITVEDFLARRIRLLFIDAKAAIECAPLVASIMAAELNKNAEWMNIAINQFTEVATAYLSS